MPDVAHWEWADQRKAMRAYDSLLGGHNHFHRSAGRKSARSVTCGLLNAKQESGTVSLPAKALYQEEGILQTEDGALVSQ